MNGANKVILVGHLGRDPEIRRTQSGDQVATFSVATGETWKDRETGEKRERVEWHNIVTFNVQRCPYRPHSCRMNLRQT